MAGGPKSVEENEYKNDRNRPRNAKVMASPHNFSILDDPAIKYKVSSNFFFGTKLYQMARFESETEELVYVYVCITFTLDHKS